MFPEVRAGQDKRLDLVYDHPMAEPTHRTDANGRFTIDRVPLGSHVIAIYKGYREVHVRATTGTTGTYRMKL